jgi:hypothetical protein
LLGKMVVFWSLIQPEIYYHLHLEQYDLEIAHREVVVLGYCNFSIVCKHLKA